MRTVFFGFGLAVAVAGDAAGAAASVVKSLPATIASGGAFVFFPVSALLLLLLLLLSLGLDLDFDLVFCCDMSVSVGGGGGRCSRADSVLSVARACLVRAVCGFLKFFGTAHRPHRTVCTTPHRSERSIKDF